MDLYQLWVIGKWATSLPGPRQLEVRETPVWLACSAGKHLGLFPLSCGSQNIFIFPFQLSSQHALVPAKRNFSHTWPMSHFREPGLPTDITGVKDLNSSDEPLPATVFCLPLVRLFYTSKLFLCFVIMLVGGRRVLSGSPAVTPGIEIWDKSCCPTV